MINDIMASLMNKAMDFGYSVIVDNRFSSRTPSAVNPYTKTIVVNGSWHDPEQLPFQLAHEMGHLINKDDSNCLYFSPSKYGIEGRANVQAIKLLLPYYTDERPLEDFNSVDFMRAFKIPQYLESVVNEEFYKNY